MSVNEAQQDRRVVVVDYGGVLTNPIADTIGQFAEHLGCQPADLLRALANTAGASGEPPMARLERAEITELEFLRTMGDSLSEITGRPTDLSAFREAWFLGRTVNGEMIEYLRKLRDRGQPLAMLSNNVLEWEPRWRNIVPAQELFEEIVISANEQCRKPEPRIYEITTERLGVPAGNCLLIDDDQTNCEAAQAHGMHAHRFTETAGAVEAIERWLPDPTPADLGKRRMASCQ
ncbi:MAG: HAD family phosphatase [Actinomycetota bacterium]|nr:HAD family phosphatase [Actinomycetota bacterium]